MNTAATPVIPSVRHEIKSTMFAEIGYVPETKTTVVHLHSGRRYGYTPMTREEYDAFAAAPSAGRYFGEHMRNNRALTTIEICGQCHCEKNVGGCSCSGPEATA